jgi:phosphatidylethanolamine-binding protein (PEBP) family uncharacterized protein
VPRVRLKRPHSAQARILAEQRRFNVVCLGRRTGKTTLAVNLLAEAAIHGQPVAYFAPTYKLLAEFWREAKRTLSEVIIEKSEQNHRIEVLGGGTLECWSLDDENPARGRMYALIVIDEAAIVRNLVEIWQQALRPTLTDLRGGAWFFSTPRGINGFYELFKLGEDPLESDWASWQMPTSVNPFIAADELEAARRELPERSFQQEYRAEFISFEGSDVFRGVDAVAYLDPVPPQRGHQYVFGVDWGRSNDYTVVSVLDASTDEQVALDRFTQIDFELQSERLHRWFNVFHPRGIVAEANAMGQPIVERLQMGYARLDGQYRPGLPIQAWWSNNAAKAAIIQDLSVSIEDGKIALLDDAVQTGELIAYESTRLPSGLLRYGAPSGGHDDTVIALALAWSAASVDTRTYRTGYAFSR